MQIHELSLAMQRDRERELCKALKAHSLLLGRSHHGRRGPIGRLLDLVRRPRPAAPVRVDPTRV